MLNLTDQSAPILPGDGLIRAAPAARGTSSARIGAFLDDIEAAGLELHGILIWHDGALVAEGFRWPYSRDRGRILHSVTKSFLACAIGILIEEGRLALDDRLFSFFPGIVSPEGLERLTIDDLLTMRTGHDIEVSGSLWRGIETSWIAEFFKIPIVHEPGTLHVYSSAASYMLSAVVTRVTGETVHNYLRPRLFEPLGIVGDHWEIGPDGFNPGGNGLTAPISAALKLGVLHVQHGMWGRKRVLPAWWVARSTMAQGAFDYGYHWAVSDGYYAALGVFVQAVFVYPADKAVIALMGAIEESKLLLPHLNRHFPTAFREGPSLSADKGLSIRLCRWEEPKAIGSYATPHAGLLGVSVWRIKPNSLGIKSLELDVGAKIIRLRMEDQDGSHAIEMAVGDWTEVTATLPGADLHHGYPLTASAVVSGAQWLSPQRLEVIWHFVESAFRDTVILDFDGDEVRFYRHVNINSGPRSWPTLSGSRLRNPLP